MFHVKNPLFVTCLLRVNWPSGMTGLIISNNKKATSRKLFVGDRPSDSSDTTISQMCPFLKNSFCEILAFVLSDPSALRAEMG